jgi:hypothetical protein
MWLRTYYYYPSDETCDLCCKLTIQPYGTLNTVWQAVCAIDPSFPTRGPRVVEEGIRIELWQRLPSPDLFRNALAFATH